MDKGIKLYTTFKDAAKEALMWYSREQDYRPTIGDINE